MSIPPSINNQPNDMTGKPDGKGEWIFSRDSPWKPGPEFSQCQNGHMTTNAEHCFLCIDNPEEIWNEMTADRKTKWIDFWITDIDSSLPMPKGFATNQGCLLRFHQLPDSVQNRFKLFLHDTEHSNYTLEVAE